MFCAKLFATPANALEFDIAGTGGNCTGCQWISASGIVELDDDLNFEKFLASADWEIKPFRSHNLIMFNSPGGSLWGGMKLGKKIRELGFAVGIGKTTPVPDSAFAELKDGECISACAYAFLGGKYRYLDEANNCLGFRQFFDKSAINFEVENATLSTRQSTQVISGIVVEYLNGIGAPLDIFTFASKFIGKEFGCLNKDAELKKAVDNSGYDFTDAKLLPFGNGLVAEIKSLSDERSMRFYCMNNGKSFLAYFLPGDVKNDYSSLLVESGDLSGLKFSANQNTITPRVELVQLIANGTKTAIIFSVEKSLINNAFAAGSLNTGSSNTGRAQQSWFDAFNFSIAGSAKMPNLIARNCIS